MRSKCPREISIHYHWLNPWCFYSDSDIIQTLKPVSKTKRSCCLTPTGRVHLSPELTTHMDGVSSVTTTDRGQTLPRIEISRLIWKKQNCHYALHKNLYIWVSLQVWQCCKCFKTNPSYEGCIKNIDYKSFDPKNIFEKQTWIFVLEYCVFCSFFLNSSFDKIWTLLWNIGPNA